MRPGGRMVLVDFVWRAPDSRARISPELTEAVRRTWQWENFESLSEYQANARASGFDVHACHDWSDHVTTPLQTVFTLVAWLARRPWGQAVLRRQNPLLRAFTPDDWEEFQHSARAHTAVRAHSRYVALVLQRGRPASSAAPPAYGHAAKQGSLRAPESVTTEP